MRGRRVLTTLCSVLCAANGYGTTVAKDLIIDDSVEWTPAGSPYVLQGSVNIENNGFLHILAGVTVRILEVACVSS